MIVTGCNFIVLLITSGWMKLPSIPWITMFTMRTTVPTRGPWAYPTKTAGVAPM